MGQKGELMAMYVTNGEIFIGYEYFKDIRKRPCICVRQENEIIILGTFSNEEKAMCFVDKLAEMVNAIKESENN